MKIFRLLVALTLISIVFPQRVQATDLGSVLPGGNTADGFYVLTSPHLTGGYNTGTGWFSLFTLSSGSFNTAFGAATLFSNTGDNNTAVGTAALFSNTDGDSNDAIGNFALAHNTIGVGNTACGVNALGSNSTGNVNTAVGRDALALNDTADYDTAVGWQALSSNTTGLRNTAIGVRAGYLVQGDGNVEIGADVNGDPGDINVTRIRNVGSTPIVGGINVVIAGTSDLGDQMLGYASSSRRYKRNIEPMDKASETLFALKPVTFRAKDNLDSANVRHYGLIAEDVATVNPDLVVFNPEGKPETLRFDSINAMLLNEFLKEHRKVELHDRKALEQQKEIDLLKAELNEQKALIQKVSARLATARPSLADLK